MKNRNFTPFPVLKTERLILRKLLIDDQQSVFALRSNADINKYLDREPCKAIEDAVDFISKVNNNVQKNNSVYWVISLTKTNSFAGTICLYDFSDDTNNCEIGYELMTEFQGQGLMQEAANAVINYAFQTLQVEKVVAFTHNKNQNSTRLLKKIGFQHSGEADKDNPDLDVYTLTYSDWHS